MIFLYLLTLLICAAGLGGAVWLGRRLLKCGPDPASHPAAHGQVLSLLWTVFLGLFAFFVLESGVARRISADLLLPIWGARPYPGRALRMGACLCLALAAGIWGGGARAKLRSLLQRDAGCWLAAAAVTVLFLLWTWRVTVIRFMTSDDTYLLQSIGSNAFRGMSDAFSHELFCAFIHFFYRLWPDGYWYTLYHLIILAAAATIAGRCLHLKLRGRDLPTAAGFVLHGLLCAGLFLCVTAELSFTVTSAAAGTAAVMLLLCRDDTDSAVGHLVTDLASVVLALLCRLQRQAAWQPLSCFWLLAAGYQLLRTLVDRKPRLLLRVVTLLAALAVTLGALSGVDRVHLDLEDTAYTPGYAVPQHGYTQAQTDYFRSRVMDYLLVRLTNEQLEAVGIPSELGTLLRGWFFMDERINSVTFDTITASYSGILGAGAASPAPEDSAPAGDTADTAGGVSQPPTAGLLSRLGAALRASRAGAAICQLRSALHTSTEDELDSRVHTMGLLTYAMALLAALLLLRLVRYGLSGILETLCGLCAGGGGTLMLLYLIQEGRFPLRVFMAAAFPAILTMVLMAASAPAKPARSRPQKAAAGLSGMLAAGLCALALLTAWSVPYASQNVSRQDVFAGQIAAESYASANPDVTFVTNMLTNDLDPFHRISDYPPNLLRWGGIGRTTASEQLYADAFFRDDVQFLYGPPSSIVAMLQYLTLDWGPVQARVVSQLTSEISVVSFSQISPGPDYTGWYEQNGMRYYFQDGQALAGEQRIGGESFTFAPAGEDSQLVAAPGPEGLIYTTDAYSLIDPEAETP